MIIKPKSKGFICLTAHPTGCYKNIEDMVSRAKEQSSLTGPARPRNVIVVGASSGYGMAARIVAAFAYGANTVGISWEKEAQRNRTATAGYYNNHAFDQLAAGLTSKHITINGDAFSDEAKEEVIRACRDAFAGGKADLLIYSIAAPTRIDPLTRETYSSVIKPIGAAYANKTVNFQTGVVHDVEIAPATAEEIAQTIKVMGGEDWNLWIDKLSSAAMLAEGFMTAAFSYIGPELTHAIYKDGTIGRAKDDLLRHSQMINEKLKPLGGGAFISVNKALVTQASAAIPVVPLYISLLYKIMKEKGLHEGCYEQMRRLFQDKLYLNSPPAEPPENPIRLDNLEMREDVQRQIKEDWQKITSESVYAYSDLLGYRDEFFSLFGFGRSDVDYDKPVEWY